MALDLSRENLQIRMLVLVVRINLSFVTSSRRWIMQRRSIHLSKRLLEQLSITEHHSESSMNTIKCVLLQLKGHFHLSVCIGH